MLVKISKKISLLAILGVVAFSSQNVFALEVENLPTTETQISKDAIVEFEKLEVSLDDLPIDSQQSVGLSCVVGVNSGSVLNVRSQPNTSSSIVGSLRPGQHVTWSIFQGTTPSSWTLISAPVRGYVSNQFLADGNPFTGVCPA